MLDSSMMDDVPMGKDEFCLEIIKVSVSNGGSAEAAAYEAISAWRALRQSDIDRSLEKLKAKHESDLVEARCSQEIQQIKMQSL